MLVLPDSIHLFNGDTSFAACKAAIMISQNLVTSILCTKYWFVDKQLDSDTCSQPHVIRQPHTLQATAQLQAVIGGQATELKNRHA